MENFTQWNDTTLLSLSSSSSTLSTSHLLPAHTTSWSEALWYWGFLPYLFSEVVYWVVALGFALVDFLLPPATLASQKLQPTRLPVSTPEKAFAYRSAVVTSAYNQVVGSIPCMLAFTAAAHHLQLPVHAPLPSLPMVLWQVAVVLLVEEALFYYAHRLLHLPWFYARFHRVHHEWVAPVAVSATCCHLVEHVCANVLPMLLGVLAARAHWWLLVGWTLVGVSNTVCVHSGFSWAWLKAANHDRHHSTNKCAFGAIGLLDWVHGTRYVDLAQSAGEKAGKDD